MHTAHLVDRVSVVTPLPIVQAILQSLFIQRQAETRGFVQLTGVHGLQLLQLVFAAGNPSVIGFLGVVIPLAVALAHAHIGHIFRAVAQSLHK